MWGYMNTKAMLVGAAAAIALTVPADAANLHGWYIGLEAGGNWIEDADVTGDGNPNWEASFDAGWAGLVTLGYAWNSFRAELELGYRANDIDTFFTGKTFRNVGEFNEFSQMLNLMYDYDLDRWSLSFGAGAGGDRIDYEDLTVHTIPIDDTDWVFAWQLLASLNYHINQRTDLFIGYRYFNAENPEFSDFGGEALHTDDYDTVHKHTATVGIRYALWGEEPVEVVAPPPPPPPPEPIAPPKEFIVFFGHNKTNLVAEAMKVIHEAAEAAKQYGAANVRVVGHADRSGSAKYNDGLSLRRADVVKSALVAEGIPAGAVTVSARGESEPLVPTADGVREPQNRRVNITM
jgi:OmpA-OmpF porin, OOP family